MKTVIGISGLYHDSAAAVVRGNDILAAAQEERFSRTKHDPRFPRLALEYCVSQAGGRDAVDAVAFYEDTVLSFDRVLKNAIESAPGTESIWPLAAASQLGQKFALPARLGAAVGPKAADNVFLVDHHTSHAASAFYPSPHDDAAIVVVDGIGEWASTTVALGKANRIESLSQISYPHSLGLLFSAFTYHCGLKVNSGEYKLMGLAPYGEPRYVQRVLDTLIDLREDGSFRLNTEYFAFMTSDTMTNEAFEAVMGCPRREPESQLTVEYMDIAASCQAIIDLAMLRISRHALKLTGSRNLCLAGGVALNCVTNGKLLKSLPEMENIWIQPAAGDAGGALGAALHVAHAAWNEPRQTGSGLRDAQKGSLLGPDYAPDTIEQALQEAGVVYHRAADTTDHVERVARALADGLIVGRFDGRMEFGPRALGNRSIIADPRRPDGQTHINLRIKFRESWRPFAPVVLDDKVSEYFEMEKESPYMLLVADVRQHLRHSVDWSNFRDGDADMMKVLNQPRSTLPSITHVDYSARVQTVDAERNPAFHQLLSRFNALTGCPVLINTSFNQRGEPIVCEPADAVRCFINTGIDVLAIGPFVVFKSEQSAEIKAQEGKIEYELD